MSRGRLVLAVEGTYEFKRRAHCKTLEMSALIVPVQSTALFLIKSEFRGADRRDTHRRTSDRWRDADGNTTVGDHELVQQMSGTDSVEVHGARYSRSFNKKVNIEDVVKFHPDTGARYVAGRLVLVVKGSYEFKWFAQCKTLEMSTLLEPAPQPAPQPAPVAPQPAPRWVCDVCPFFTEGP